MEMAAEYYPARYDTQTRCGWGLLLDLLYMVCCLQATIYYTQGWGGVQIIPGISASQGAATEASQITKACASQLEHEGRRS